MFKYLLLLNSFMLLTANNSCKREDNLSNLDVINKQLENLSLDSGSQGYDSFEYSLPAAIDERVTSKSKTDVRGKIFLPRGQGPFPVLVFLHGNHDTCELIANKNYYGQESSAFTETGACPRLWRESPSYLGYDYLSEYLASHGFVTVSINANRGITASNKGVMIKERGLLVLKHLAVLQKWNDATTQASELKFDLRNKLDFKHVGLMGHSRGGEGVRAAYKIYKESRANSYAKDIKDMTIEGIFELAPVDSFTDEIFNVDGANWTVVIGTCDGDVSDYQGVSTFVRRRGKMTNEFSSILAIAGANHNFFNTEWQTPETQCDPGDSEMDARTQQKLSTLITGSFFKAFVGPSKDLDLQNIFDPQYSLPNRISQLGDIYRESLAEDAAMLVVENNHAGNQVEIDQLNQNSRNLVHITSSSQESSYTSKVSISSRTVHSYDIISLAISAKDDTTCSDGESCGLLDLSISLLYDDQTESDEVSLLDYVSITRLPFTCTGTYKDMGWCVDFDLADEVNCQDASGVYLENTCYVRNDHPRISRQLLFWEVPIEFSDFSYEDKNISGIKLSFDKLTSSSIYLDRTFVLRKNL